MRVFIEHKQKFYEIKDKALDHDANSTFEYIKANYVGADLSKMSPDIAEPVDDLDFPISARVYSERVGWTVVAELTSGILSECAFDCSSTHEHDCDALNCGFGRKDGKEVYFKSLETEIDYRALLKKYIQHVRPGILDAVYFGSVLSESERQAFGDILDELNECD